MQIVSLKNALLPLEAVRAARGNQSRSGLHADQQAGLMTRSVNLGGRTAAIPAHEVEEINSAWIAGKTSAEVRALVAELHARRTLTA